MRDEHLLNGRYRLIEILGSNAVSVVWRAHDESLNRIVAVRVFGEAQAAVHDRLVAEAQAAVTLAHPQVIQVFDYGEALGPTGERLPYLVTELVTGGLLADPSVLDSLSADEALTVCAQMADALTATHQHGLVHGEIQPSNVVLTMEGAKILDLGAVTAARIAGQEEYASVHSRPSHWAPERQPGGDVTPAADVYALGVLMYWLLSDQPPPAPIHGVPAKVVDICHRCLARDPEARPTAAQVAHVLNSPPPSLAAPGHSTVDDDSATWSSTGRAVESHRAGRRRSPVAILVGVAAVVLLAGVVAVLASIGPSDDTSTTGGTPAHAEADGGASPTYLDPSLTPTPATTPSGGDPSVAATTPAQLPPDQTFTAVGGTVEARCEGNAARLVAAQPAAGFVIADSNQRPANQVQVVFTSPTHRSEVRAKCGPQGLVPTIRESALPAP